MGKKTTIIPGWWFLVAILSLPFFGGCSKAYSDAMEKVGIHKRDILVDRGSMEWDRCCAEALF